MTREHLKMILNINDKRLATIILLVCLTLSSSASFAAGADASVFRFQKTMADKGLPQAQYKLAMMYESGIGVEQNLIHARLWYVRAALQNFKPARHRLTYLDIKQNGFVGPQHAEWIKQLKREAVFGEGESLFLLGQMYAEGTGVQQNLEKSLELLKKAAASNIAGADAERLRVESMYLAQKEQQKKLRMQKAAEQQQAIQQQQQIEKQRQQRLEQQRLVREQQLIAARKHQLELARQRQADRNLAEQQARIAARQASLMITETTASNICSGRNRFSATCR